MSENNKNKPTIKVYKIGPWFFPTLIILLFLAINFFDKGFSSFGFPEPISVSKFEELLAKNENELPLASKYFIHFMMEHQGELL